MNRTVITTVAVVTAAMAVGLAPIANADTSEDVYIDSLHSQGIRNRGGDAQMLNGGYAVCRSIANGLSPLQAAAIVYRVTDSSISAYDAGYVVGAAISSLCPQYTSLIG